MKRLLACLTLLALAACGGKPADAPKAAAKPALTVSTTTPQARDWPQTLAATGNVAKVQSKGIEFDGVYAGIKNTTIRFSGAYTDARYKDFKNSAQPNENGYTGAAPYQDVSGQTLPGASKWTFNVGADYNKPVFGDKVFHASFTTAYTGKANTDELISSYAWVPDHATTDLAIGLGITSDD